MRDACIHSKQYTLSETETIEPKVQRRSWSKSRGARNAAGRSNHRPMVRGERGQRAASMSQDLPLGAARASMSQDRPLELHLLRSQDLPLELRLRLFPKGHGFFMGSVLVHVHEKWLGGTYNKYSPTGHWLHHNGAYGVCVNKEGRSGKTFLSTPPYSPSSSLPSSSMIQSPYLWWYAFTLGRLARKWKCRSRSTIETLPTLHAVSWVLLLLLALAWLTCPTTTTHSSLAQASFSTLALVGVVNCMPLGSCINSSFKMTARVVATFTFWVVMELLGIHQSLTWKAQTVSALPLFCLRKWWCWLTARRDVEIDGRLLINVASDIDDTSLRWRDIVSSSSYHHDDDMDNDDDDGSSNHGRCGLLLLLSSMFVRVILLTSNK